MPGRRRLDPRHVAAPPAATPDAGRARWAPAGRRQSWPHYALAVSLGLHAIAGLGFLTASHAPLQPVTEEDALALVFAPPDEPAARDESLPHDPSPMAQAAPPDSIPEPPQPAAAAAPPDTEPPPPVTPSREEPRPPEPVLPDPVPPEPPAPQPTPAEPTPPEPTPPEPKLPEPKPATTPPQAVPRRPPPPVPAPSRPSPARKPSRPPSAPAANLPAGPPSPAPQPTPAPEPPAASAAADAGWRSAVARWLNQHRHYPEQARMRGEEGTVGVTFVAGRDGQVLEVTITRSSGVPALDQAVRDMLAGARLPAFPGTMEQARISLTVAVRFSLED